MTNQNRKTKITTVHVGNETNNPVRNIVLPVSGLVVFPEAGTHIDPAIRPGRTLIHYMDEEFGRQPFTLPAFATGEAIQLYSRMSDKKKGILLTAKITAGNERRDSSRTEWESDRHLGAWPFADWTPSVEVNSSVEVEGFLTYDASQDPERLFKGKIWHSFGYLSLYMDGVAVPLSEAFGLASDKAVVSFSLRKRDYRNLSALCRVGKVKKIDDGKETVFWDG